jgi:hypothetical protein
MNHAKSTGITLVLLTSALGATAVSAQTNNYTTMSLNGTTAPATGPYDVSQLNASGGQDNSHDFTDNSGGPGQSLTAPTGGTGQFLLTGITLLGRGNAGYSNSGNPDVGDWHYRISSVSGSTLTPLSYYYAPGSGLDAGATPVEQNNQYFTTDVNQVVTGGGQYAFDVYSENGYFGLADGPTPNNLTGGSALNSASTSRTFDSDTVTDQNYSRTFEAHFSVLNSTTVVTGSTFTPGAGDIGQFDSSAALNGSQDYSDNGPHPGQTFTTGASPQGYALQSLTVRGGNSAGNGYQSGSFFLRISQVGSGNTLTPLAVFQASASGVGATDFLTFNLASANLTLAGNTQYAYDLFTDQGYYGFAAGANTTGGAIQVAGNRSFSIADSYTTDSYSRYFDVKLAAAPEPSQFAALGLGLMGLGGLVLRARCRSVNA